MVPVGKLSVHASGPRGVQVPSQVPFSDSRGEVGMRGPHSELTWDLAITEIELQKAHYKKTEEAVEKA